MDWTKGLGRKVTERFTEVPRVEPYQYSRLSTAPDSSYTRIFHLQPGNASDVLRGRLVHVDLDAPPLLSYDAVSYTWSRNRLWIQRNLYDFLVRLREFGKFRPLWIDALCIDQDESSPEVKAEKMQQLRMMGRIYSSAETVLVWLGEYAGVSTSLPRYLDSLAHLDRHEHKPYTSEHDVIERMKQDRSLEAETKAMFGFGSHMESPDEGGESEPTTLCSSKIVRYFSLFKTVASASLHVVSMVEAVTRLLTGDYFQRAWVVQEITLAKQLVFFIGATEISSTSLLRAVRLLEVFANGKGMGPFVPFASVFRPKRAGYRAIPHLLQARQRRLDNKPSWAIEDLLFLCRDREATRPEDKVYSSSATHATPAVFEIKRRASDSSIAWSLTVSATIIDVVEQVGESYDEVWDYMYPLIQQDTSVAPLEGHTLDLVSKLGRDYNPTRQNSRAEPTLDAFLRTMTGDVLKRLPREHHQQGLLPWEPSDDDKFQFSLCIVYMFLIHTTKVDQFLGSRAWTSWASVFEGDRSHLHVRAADINGTHIKLSNAMRSFLDIHGSSKGYSFEELRYSSSDEGDGAAKSPGGASIDDALIAFHESGTHGVFVALSSIYQDRRIFRTRDQNFIGVCHDCIDRGDVVVLIAGAETPFVLRPVLDDEGKATGQYTVIGRAYVHGIMYGSPTSAADLALGGNSLDTRETIQGGPQGPTPVVSHAAWQTL
ncbi:heterokaryon incompatibility protein-domain-containing protein [Podospora aff. communis PSN243]|uniref:Heterokaryon incompatibility protein-domain-containing protein n=1 Tax=Podospora aff. communis PSN243 TaxID=3040156 RepID=A0AAV9GET9_9PEZI|nr:heterokaryon incompatibility protein-domain-containing protein [Podospora aff. communis PSN243]